MHRPLFNDEEEYAATDRFNALGLACVVVCLLALGAAVLLGMRL